MLSAFLYGVILAFGLIIPLGIQNIFLFNQGATQKHFLHALPSVLAAFFCDTLLILLAVLGVSLIVLKLAWLKTIILLVGFFFLAYMGWITWNSHPAKMEHHPKPMTAKQQITFAMSVSLLNPHAILDSIGVIGTNALHFSHQALFAYTLGCILVSLCWFFGLSVTGHFLHRLDKSGKLIKILNKVSAIIIWLVAIYIAKQLIM